MVDTALAKVTQLPIIENQLSGVLPSIKERCDLVASLVVDEENYKEMKKIRADMNREYDEFKKMVREIENTIKAPFNDFKNGICSEVEKTYKDGISQLDGNIKDTENGLKSIRSDELHRYFDDYRDVLCLDESLVTIEKSGIKVGLSGSMKSLKEQARAFLDRVDGDVKMIDTLSDRDEVFSEYRKSLNVTDAVRVVADRHKMIEEEKKRREAEEEARRERERKEVEVDAAVEAQKQAAEESSSEDDSYHSPVQKIAVEPTEESSEKILSTQYLGYQIYGTLEQMKALKAYLVNALVEYLEKEGMKYGK